MSTDNGQGTSPEVCDQMRETVWDRIYREGEQSVAELSQQLGISLVEMQTVLNHDWFVVDGDSVKIA